MSTEERLKNSASLPTVTDYKKFLDIVVERENITTSEQMDKARKKYGKLTYPQWNEYLNGKQENFISHDVIKFASVDRNLIPLSLQKKIQGMHVYYDTDNTLNEHLYSQVDIIDQHRQRAIFDEQEEKIFEKLVKELEEKDCAYFRLVNS